LSLSIIQKNNFHIMPYFLFLLADEKIIIILLFTYVVNNSEQNKTAHKPF
jgi:hypothetical protein